MVSRPVSFKFFLHCSCSFVRIHVSNISVCRAWQATYIEVCCIRHSSVAFLREGKSWFIMHCCFLFSGALRYRFPRFWSTQAWSEVFLPFRTKNAENEDLWKQSELEPYFQRPSWGCSLGVSFLLILKKGIWSDKNTHVYPRYMPNRPSEKYIRT